MKTDKKISRETKILHLLYKHDDTGLTARELAYMLRYTERNATAPRLTKFVKNDMVYVAYKKQDKITKKSVSVYKLTDNYKETLRNELI